MGIEPLWNNGVKYQCCDIAITDIHVYFSRRKILEILFSTL